MTSAAENAFFGMQIGRNTAAVVRAPCRSRPHSRSRRRDRQSAEGFVDGVIDDFVNHMVQARNRRRYRPIYMPGRLRTASRPFQHLDGVGAVVLRFLRCLIRRFAHVSFPKISSCAFRFPFITAARSSAFAWAKPGIRSIAEWGDNACSILHQTLTDSHTGGGGDHDGGGALFMRPRAFLLARDTANLRRETPHRSA